MQNLITESLDKMLMCSYMLVENESFDVLTRLLWLMVGESYK